MPNVSALAACLLLAASVAAPRAAVAELTPEELRAAEETAARQAADGERVSSAADGTRTAVGDISGDVGDPVAVDTRTNTAGEVTTAAEAAAAGDAAADEADGVDTDAVVANAGAALDDILESGRGADTGVVYDYIVVGGGTAGVAVAARLCRALPDRTVALLERGEPRSPEIQALVEPSLTVPASWFTSAAETFDATVSPGLANRAEGVIAGNTLGGSSTLNAGQWLRPDFDEVADWGVSGLDAAAAERLVRKAERAVRPRVPTKELQQTYVDVHLAAHAALDIDTVRFETQLDDGEVGVFVNRVAADKNSGKKGDSVSAYLDPVWPEGKCADNLDVIQGARVTRINTRNGRSTGVEYTTSDGTVSAAATAEVILAAGPYGTPQLLQVSGIGPTEVLEAAGVDVVADLPVGANTQARALQALLTAYPGMPLADEANSTLLADPAQALAFAAGKPSLLGTGLGSTITALPFGYAESSTVLSGVMDAQIFTTFCIIDPTARGSVKIASADVTEPPTVDQNLFGVQADIDKSKECLNFLRDLMGEWPADFLITEIAPGEGAPSDAQGTAFHFVGGAPVGDVLDAKLRVEGFANLRVVDASAIPQIPRGAGPMAAVYLLAERAAELLIEDAAAAVKRADIIDLIKSKIAEIKEKIDLAKLRFGASGDDDDDDDDAADDGDDNDDDDDDDADDADDDDDDDEDDDEVQVSTDLQSSMATVTVTSSET